PPALTLLPPRRSSDLDHADHGLVQGLPGHRAVVRGLERVDRAVAADQPVADAVGIGYERADRRAHASAARRAVELRVAEGEHSRAEEHTSELQSREKL